MQVPAFNEASLSPFLNKLEIFTACIQQTEKDLHTYGIQIPRTIPGIFPLKELLQTIQPQIAFLMQKGNSISDLLYRVDVSENLLHKALKEFPETPIDELVSRLIILRELQKVVTRLHGNANQDNENWLED